ncbi:MAG TPA: class I SAM-dependent methyltransferase [Solirubrobacteraceae bacterium]|nr:class I SAM-dependent methyltransferase [Solirubrobacteraceae bacterium]
MPSRDYHEALWSALPAAATPPDLELRSRFLLASVTPGQRVLDVGCGEGELAARLQDAGAEVVAVDVAQVPLDRARARHPGLDLRLIDGEGHWDLPDASFDVVWAGEVIEHVADTAGWLSEARRVLRPGGLLLLSTPAHGPLVRLWLALRPGAFAAHMHPLSDHLRFYERGGLSRLLEEFRFEGVRVRTAGRAPARASLLASARRARF